MWPGGRLKLQRRPKRLCKNLPSGTNAPDSKRNGGGSDFQRTDSTDSHGRERPAEAGRRQDRGARRKPGQARCRRQAMGQTDLRQAEANSENTSGRPAIASAEADSEEKASKRNFLHTTTEIKKPVCPKTFQEGGEEGSESSGFEGQKHQYCSEIFSRQFRVQNAKQRAVLGARTSKRNIQKKTRNQRGRAASAQTSALSSASNSSTLSTSSSSTGNSFDGCDSAISQKDQPVKFC